MNEWVLACMHACMNEWVSERVNEWIDKWMKLLTHIEVRCRPIAVKVGLQFVILAAHFNSLRITVDRAAEFFFPEVIIAFLLVDFRDC